MIVEGADAKTEKYETFGASGGDAPTLIGCGGGSGTALATTDGDAEADGAGGDHRGSTGVPYRDIGYTGGG